MVGAAAPVVVVADVVVGDVLGITVSVVNDVVAVLSPTVAPSVEPPPSQAVIPMTTRHASAHGLIPINIASVPLVPSTHRGPLGTSIARPVPT